MSDFIAVYYVRLNGTKLETVRYAYNAEIEERFGEGKYNLGFYNEDDVDRFVEWCEVNEVEYKLV